jgi:monoterpene epsilon-lactone hydrolase
MLPKERWEGKPGSLVSIAERRRKLGAHEGWMRRPPVGTTTSELPLGGVPTVRVSRPGAQQGRHVLFLHGGGYITGSPALYRHILWRFAEACRAEIAAIDYRLAPEHPFPAALDDACPPGAPFSRRALIPAIAQC